MTLIKIIVFIFGMCLCVQLAAAFFSLIDLWYRIGDEYPGVIRKIVLWSSICVFFTWLFGDMLRPAYLSGMAAFLVFHVMFFLAGKILIRYSSLSD